MIEPVGRSRARYLAPAALLAAAVATALVVAGGLHPTSAHRPRGGVPRGHAARRSLTHHQPTARLYVVRSGDTLSAISLRTRIPLATLEALNPGVNPTGLQTGQRLRLR
jgi:hypothetical protein